MIARTPVLTPYYRQRLARHLYAYGPTPVAGLAAALDLPLAEVRALTRHPWFRITGAGWALAREGRAWLGLDGLAG